MEDDLVATSRSEATVQSLRDFGGAWLQFKVDPTAEVRKLYVDDNPNKDDLAALETLGTTGAYDVTHTRFHPGFRNQIAARGYRDLYLFDLKGFMVYSVNKAEDFGTSFAEGGPLASSSLGQVFAAGGGHRKSRRHRLCRFCRPTQPPAACRPASLPSRCSMPRAARSACWPSSCPPSGSTR